jgi:anti-sigma B factor antagonist
MQVDVRDDRGIVFVEPVGDIDGKTAPEFQETVLGLVQPSARIVLNLKRVAFMSSAGLRAMLLVYREAKSKAAKVVLAEVNNDIRGSMSATGFLAFFVLCDSVQVQESIWETA